MRKILIIFLLLCCITTIPAATAEAELPRWGPYITSLNETSVTIHYRLFEEAPGSVEIITDESETIRINSDSQIFHHISVENLAPDTEYRYRIFVNESWSDLYRFHTFGAENYTFIVSGDTRSEPPFRQIDRHGIVADAILKTSPLFVVHLGDFCGEARDPAEWDQFFEAGRNLYANTIIIPVQGNHDDGPLYREIFGMDDWYFFDAGKIHFMVLNTNGWTATRFDAQTSWLKDEVSGNATKIAFFHHPFFTTDQKRSGLTADQKLIWEDLFVTGNVPATYSAHMHAYERYYSRGIQYITNGAGGAPLYSPMIQPEDELVTSVYFTLGYVRVKVTGDEFSSEFLKIAEVANDNSAILSYFPSETIGDGFSMADPATNSASPSLLIPALVLSITANALRKRWSKS